MVTTKDLFPYFNGKKVFVTGHTGFKGAWMIQILARLGATIKGYSLAAQPQDLYTKIDGDAICESIIANINDVKKLTEELHAFEPDYIFHMAAQALVIEGYQHPLSTFETNTQGTANMLEAIRMYKNKCICVFITTDKVYENHDNSTLFKEDDKLGGYDPYSASKAACEIIISSYRNSFFNNEKYNEHLKSIAVVRAGNVIGGGDFAANRIIPDIINAIKNNEEIVLRNPKATRPWQHILEPVCAYLYLASKMHDETSKYADAYNIGPNKEDVFTVEELTKKAIEFAGKGSYKVMQNTQQHEAQTLMLDNTKIKQAIDWQPTYNAIQAIEKTVAWYLDDEADDVKCLMQINEYLS
jgi:CDP-glucose 4,6-dehydratase